MGRLAYEFLKGSVPQSAAVVLCMREKHPLYMCFSVVWGFFVWITLWVWRRGRGRPACSQEKLFEEQKREREVIRSRRVPHQPAVPRGRTWCIADPSGSRAWGFFFQLFFADCAVVSDGYGSWKEDLTTGQRGRDFLQPFFTEKPSKSFGAAESSWGKTPTSSAVVIADNEL